MGMPRVSNIVDLSVPPPGVADCDKQRRHHFPNAGGLEECGLEQHHQADTLHHGGLTRGAQAADYPP